MADRYKISNCPIDLFMCTIKFLFNNCQTLMAGGKTIREIIKVLSYCIIERVFYFIKEIHILMNLILPNHGMMNYV